MARGHRGLKFAKKPTALAAFATETSDATTSSARVASGDSPGTPRASHRVNPVHGVSTPHPTQIPSTPSPAATPAATALLGASNIARVAEQIFNGEWNSAIGDLVPQLAPKVNGWPHGRGLEILGAGNRVLARSGTTSPGKEPVRVFHDHHHYRAIENGTPVHAKSDGYCFFVAATRSMGADAAAFASGGARPWVGFLEAVVEYVVAHEDEIAPFIADQDRLETAARETAPVVPPPSHDVFTPFFDAPFAPLFQASFDYFFNAALTALMPAAQAPAPCPSLPPATVPDPPPRKTGIYFRTPRS